MSDEKKCPDCASELVDGVCSKCKPSAEKKSSETNPAVSPIGSGGWGAPVNRTPSSSTSSDGMFNR